MYEYTAYRCLSADAAESELFKGFDDHLLRSIMISTCSTSRLSYRMVFAVATKEAVYIYDTQQLTPFAVLANLHLLSLSDLAWSASAFDVQRMFFMYDICRSPDGTQLVICSQDGYCSIVTFAENEIGTRSCVTIPKCRLCKPYYCIASHSISAASLIDVAVKTAESKPVENSAANNAGTIDIMLLSFAVHVIF